MELKLNQVVGQNAFLMQHKLAVHAILGTLRDPRGGDAWAGYAEPHHDIPLTHAIVLWMFGAIGSRRVIPPDGMIVVVQRYRPHIMKWAVEWAAAITCGHPLKPMYLAVADRKLVQLTGISGFFDLQRCAHESGILPQTFEGISYNLAVPVELEWARIQRESSNGAEQQASRRTPRPHHSGHRPVGDGRRAARPGVSPMGSSNHQDGAGGADGGAIEPSGIEPSDGSDRAGNDGRILSGSSDVHPSM